MTQEEVLKLLSKHKRMSIADMVKITKKTKSTMATNALRLHKYGEIEREYIKTKSPYYYEYFLLEEK